MRAWCQTEDWDYSLRRFHRTPRLPSDHFQNLWIYYYNKYIYIRWIRYFSRCCDQVFDNTNLRQDGFVSVLQLKGIQSIMVGKAQRQQQGAAGYIHKQKAKNRQEGVLG